MTKIHLSAIFTVPAEVLEEFKSLTQVLTKRVEETEPTTERYIWFCNSEQTEWEVRETYPDADAALAHVQNMGADLQRMMEIARLDLRVYGPANEALKGLGAQVGAKMFDFDSGFIR